VYRNPSHTVASYARKGTHVSTDTPLPGTAHSAAGNTNAIGVNMWDVAIHRLDTVLYVCTYGIGGPHVNRVIIYLGTVNGASINAIVYTANGIAPEIVKCERRR
jgi:hypothetical protein